MTIADLLNDIGRKLSRGGMTSRELASLDFEAEGRDISIRVRSTLLPPWYPSLGLIFGRIGGTFVDRGVAMAHLRCITFGEKEVSVELRAPDGPASTIFTFPIEATVGLPVTYFSAAAS